MSSFLTQLNIRAAKDANMPTKPTTIKFAIQNPNMHKLATETQRKREYREGSGRRRPWRSCKRRHRPRTTSRRRIPRPRRLVRRLPTAPSNPFPAIFYSVERIRSMMCLIFSFVYFKPWAALLPAYCDLVNTLVSSYSANLFLICFVPIRNFVYFFLFL